MWMALLAVWMVTSVSSWRDDELTIEKMVDEVMMITKADTVAACVSAGTRAAQ
jgi:hypothetical protein